MSEGSRSAAGNVTPVVAPAPAPYQPAVEDTSPTEEDEEMLMREVQGTPIEEEQFEFLPEVGGMPPIPLVDEDEEYVALQRRLQGAKAKRLAALNQEIERVEQDTVDLRSRSGGPEFQRERRLPTTAAGIGTPAVSDRSQTSAVGVKRKEPHTHFPSNDRIRVPMRKPEPYRNKSIKEHTDWITRADLIFQQAPTVYVDGFRKIIWASQYLEGEVRDRWLNWWTGMTATEQQRTTWEEFVDFLANELDDPVARLTTAHEKYAEAKQREGQSARTFLTYLETLETQMDPYTEQQKLYHYFSRLRRDLRLAITDHNLIPQTRRELCSLASKLEKNLQAKRSKPLADRVTLPRKPEKKSSKDEKKRDDARKGVPFKAAAGPTPKKVTKDLTHITCYACDRTGHYANNCPNPRKESANHTFIGNRKTGKA